MNGCLRCIYLTLHLRLAMSRALLLAQAGPHAACALTVLPVADDVSISGHLFRKVVGASEASLPGTRTFQERFVVRPLR